MTTMTQATAASPPRLSTGAPARHRMKGYLYVLPALVVFVVFLGIPVVQTVQYSFYDWDGIGASTWAGLSNYASVLTDSQLSGAFGHILILLIFYCAIPVVIALLLTLVLARGNRLPGLGVFRTLLFLPQIIASVVVATIWISIYSTDGLVNQLLHLIGATSAQHVWLGDSATALVAIGVIGSWVNIGLCLVLFLSGVQSIDPSVFESARLDGAGPIREFLAVTLPALRGQVTVGLTLTVITTLKTFDLVYVTTQGGPGTSTTVPAYEAFNRAFNTGQVGQAAAVAVVLTLLILVVSWLINRLQPKDIG